MTEATPHPLRLEMGPGSFDVLATRRDAWAACRDRGGSILQAPGVLLPWLFGLVFGTAYAVMAEETTGWALAGALVALMLVVVGADNVKFWVVLYPLIFLSPRLKLGDWSEGGEKLFGLQLYEPWILLLLCLWIPRVLAAKRLELPWSLKGTLGSLLGFGLLAIWIAPDRMLAIKVGGRTFFEPLLLFLLVTSLSWKRTELRWAAFVLLCVGIVVASASLFGYWTVEADRAHSLTRLHSYWEGTNIMAAFLGAVIPIAVGATLSASSGMAVVTGLAALLTAFVALVLTYTRGVWIGVAMALVLMVGRLRAWIWAALAGLLILLAVLVGPPEILQRTQSIFEFKQDPSASNRLALWPKVVGLIADRPLTGYGFGGFQVLFSERTDIYSYHAHDVFLDFAVNVGIPALILFLWLVGYVLVSALATVRRSWGAEGTPMVLGLWAGSVSMLTAGLFDGSVLIWPILSHTFWFVLALTYAVAVTVERDLRLSRQAVRVTPGSQ